jgi:large subunit ribosomal protein L22
VPQQQPHADQQEFRARLRFAPITSRKAKPVVDLVRGKSVNQALEQLLYQGRRAAPMLSKLIKSAIANARQGGDVDVNDLFVKYVVANEGPLKQRRKRFRPGPQGRAMPILKRMSHFELVLGVRESKKTARRTRKKAEPAAPAGKAE